MEQSFRINDISQFNKILANSFNYDRIRVYAVGLFNQVNRAFNSDNLFAGTSISEKCRIIFNPVDSLVIFKSLEKGLEQCLDYDILFDNEIPQAKAKEYKMCFIRSFIFHFESNLLEL